MGLSPLAIYYQTDRDGILPFFCELRDESSLYAKYRMSQTTRLSQVAQAMPLF